MKIGVIGAGTMGVGIAQVFAQKEGFKVFLCSSGLESARRGKEKLEKLLLKRVDAGKVSLDDAKQTLDHISVCTKADCSACDLIIESVREDFELKRNLFAEMQKICKDDCIFATNTSSLSVTELAKGIRQPVVGMHFFNPAPVMQLVEIIAGVGTSEETVNIVMQLTERVGKTPIRVKESSGFVVNRLLIPMINEAINLLEDNIATAEDIDKAMRLGANFPMGPLELADYIGLDVCLAIMRNIQEQTGNIKYQPGLLLQKLVNEGKLGKKSGEGIYSYR